MEKLLNRQKIEQQLASMWERITGIPEEDENRQEAVDEAMAQQVIWYKQLQLQDRILERAWKLCNQISHDNPIAAMDNLEQFIPRPDVIGTL